MIKRLLFYWYANSEDFINRFSLLHLYSLNLYKDIFDKKTFVISMDNPETDTILYEYTTRVILSVVPDAEFIKVRNNSEYASEAYWFKTEFIPNLYKYKNEAVFWCHGKGKGGLRYTGKKDLYIWISALYYMNLCSEKVIEDFINNDNTYMMGTMLYLINVWPYCSWHYNGGFYWMKPEKIGEYISTHETNLQTALNCDTWERRYVAEGFPGIVFKEGGHCVMLGKHYNCCLDKFDIDSHITYIKENCPNIKGFEDLYGQFIE